MNKPILLDDITPFETTTDAWNPYAWYKEMRENHPVYYHEDQQVWNVFQYKEVNQVLSDPKTFSSKRDRTRSAVPQPDTRVNLNSSDAPRHRDIRSLVSKAFTPKTLKDWEPRIQSITDDLVERMSHQTQVDIVKDFAVPLPVTVITDLLGVPHNEQQMIKAWSDVLFLPFSKGNLEDLNVKKEQAIREFQSYLLPLVQKKREQPSDDIISDLTKVEYEGDKLTDQEIVWFSLGLLGAGNETTTNLIAYSFYCFLREQPGIYQELRNDPKLIPAAVEEVLRFRFPITLDRRVTQDTELLGNKIKKDEMVMVWISSANRDEEQFPDPEIFNIHRPGNKKHLTFGKGPHFCLGAPLARLEAKIALTTFIKKFASIELSPSFDLEQHVLKDRQMLKYLPVQLKTK